MKKLLAVLIAVVMAFSIAVIPASAAAEEETTKSASAVIDSATNAYNDLKEGDYAGALDNAFIFAEELFNAIHELVGGILGVLGNECPFCDIVHGAADDDAADKPECDCTGDCTCGKEDEEEKEEEPVRPEGPAFVVDGTTQTTYGGEEYYGDIFLKATATVPVIELLSIKADVNNVVVLEAENTVVFSGGDFTLPEGGKLVVDTTGTITQVMFSTGDITVNGEILTKDNVDQYVEGVEWPWFY